MNSLYQASEILTYLQNILALPSPSGYTGQVTDYLRRELNALNISYRQTRKGAIIATIPGEDDEYQRTFSAHIDTLGAMVKALKPNGALALALVGGYMATCVEGANCTIATLDGKTYSGTIQTIKPSIHVSGDEARELKRTPENLEVIVDEKVFTKADLQNLGIEVGDYILIDPRTVITENGYIKSRYLDDQAGVAILLYCLRYLSQNGIKPAHTVNFYFSNFEEVGHGACAALPERTHEFIAVDMGAPGLEQNSTEYAVCIGAKDTSGPYHYELRRQLVQICKTYNIPYKVDVYPYYQSDASVGLRSGWDVKAALIGPGVFASHAYERTHVESLLATVDLIARYIMVANK